MQLQHRQGDVFMVRVGDTLPKGAKKMKPDKGRTILAYGEVTGHAHALPALEAPMYTSQGDRYIKVQKGGSTLRHEEHSPIPLDEGVWRIVQQREYSPEAIRNVVD